jgi:hypothetical protein
MVNLKIPAYVLAKLIVGAGLCAVQCLVLIVVVRWGCGLRAAPFSTYLVLLTLALTGLGLGLLLSAMARSTEAAIGLVPLALIPIVVFGGALLPVAKMQAPIKALAYALPLRWGFEALMLQEAERSPLGPSAFTGSLSAVDDDDPGRPDLAESHFPRAQRAGVSASVLLMVGMFLAQVAAIGTVLWLRDVV